MRHCELRATSCEPRSRSREVFRLLEARVFKHGARQSGFTILELTVVILLIMVLLAIAVPMYNQSITRTREATLRENLHTLNKLIDQYSLDKKKAPQSLDDLVQAGYLKVIPNDITGKNDTWKTEPEDPQNAMDPNQPGIVGVRSGSDAISTDGTAYSSW